MESTALLGHVLLPVANEEDAAESALALAPYDPERVTVVHVVEKGGGAPDKTPVEHSESVADKSFSVARQTFPDAGTKTVYETDVTDGIFRAADASDVTAIAFRPRGGNRLVQFLAGDISMDLITEAPVPVVALPDPDT